MTISNGQIANADDVLSSIGNVTAQLAYEQVKSDSTNWTNTDYLGADIFTDSNGAKNTIDITNISSVYVADGDYYMLSSSGAIDNIFDTFNTGTLNTRWTTSYTGINSVEFNESDYPGSAYGKGQISSGESGTKYSQMVQNTDDLMGKSIIIRFDHAGTSNYSSGGSSNYGWSIQLTDGSNSITTWSASTGNGGQTTNETDWYLKLEYSGISQYTWYLDTGTGYGSGTTVDISSLSKLFLKFSCYGYQGGSGNILQGNMKIKEILINGSDSSSTVETDTIINKVVPKSIVVYGKDDLPANTSITVDVSDDGGSSWGITGQSLNTSIDTSSFSTGDLALKFNLATTDTSVTPKLYGYGVAIVDS